jgi:hypothetical protein
MDLQVIVASLAVWTFACVAFGWWIRGAENASIAAAYDHFGSPADLEQRARRHQ